MAKLCVTSLVLFSLALTMQWAHTIAQLGSEPQESWVQNLSQSQGKEKAATLHFYIQDALGGPNRTVWEVARSNITATTPTQFGQIVVIDDLITATPDPKSMALGRAQGLITSADLNVPGLAMNINFFFTTGKYNGSTLCILGRNQILDKTRELPVVGGTGLFRMARGYAISSTYSYDPIINYGVLEYTVYVKYLDH